MLFVLNDPPNRQNIKPMIKIPVQCSQVTCHKLYCFCSFGSTQKKRQPKSQSYCSDIYTVSTSMDNVNSENIPQGWSFSSNLKWASDIVHLVEYSNITRNTVGWGPIKVSDKFSNFRCLWHKFWLTMIMGEWMDKAVYPRTCLYTCKI